MSKSHFFAALAAAAVLSSCGGKFESPADKFILGSIETDLVPVLSQSSGKFGYISPDGTMAIAPQFTQASYFHDGLAAVMDSAGIFMYIDAKGNQALDTRFASASDFNDGLAWAAEPDSALAAIDTKGNVKFRFPKATSAEIFLDGYARYRMADGTMGLVSADGSDVELPQTCKGIDGYGDGYYTIVTEGNDLKICRLNGQRLETIDVDLSFDIAGFSAEYKLIKVHSGDSYGLADLDGKIVVNPRYSMLEFDSKGLILFKSDKDKFGWLNTKGEEVIPAKYSKVFDTFGWNDYAAVSTTGNKYQLIDREGNTLIPPKYDKILATWTPGIVIVGKEDEGFGLATSEGEVLCQPQFKLLCCVARGIFMATPDDSQWGVISEKGTYEGKVDYARPLCQTAMVVTAESRLFDPQQVATLLNEWVERADFRSNMKALATVYSLDKDEVLENGWDVVLKSHYYSNLGMSLSLIMTPDNPAIVSPSYWSSRTEFNKNARPTAFTIFAEFNSTEKCRKAFDFIKTAHPDWPVQAFSPEASSFRVHIQPDGAKFLDCGAPLSEEELIAAEEGMEADDMAGPID